MSLIIPTPLPLRKPGPRDTIMADSVLWIDAGRGAQPAPPYPPAGQVLDLSSGANHGISYQALMSPLGLLLDNVDDRITFGTNAINLRLAGARGLSAAIYVRPLGLVGGTGRNQLWGFNINGSSSAACAWFTDSGKLVAGGRSQSADGFQSVSTSVAIAREQEDIFICCVLDYAASRIRVWINDKLVADQSVSFGSEYYRSGTATLIDTIGAAPAGTYPLSGIIRGFALLRSPLEPGEVARVRELMVD